MRTQTTPQLARIDFRADQCLAAPDLRQASRRTSQLLELHAARGHDVWGVARGFVCWLYGPDRVVVGAGVAVDARGRQLVNSAAQVMPFPPADPGEVFDLVASWADPLDRPCGGLGMAAEQPALRWARVATAPLVAPNYRSAASVRLGLDIPLARLTTATATDPASVDTTQRVVAHALIRPKIVTGRVPQSTGQVAGTFTDWTVLIDTSAAGFLANPTYLVSLDAHPLDDSADLSPAPAAPGIAAPPAPLPPPPLWQRLSWPGPFVSIEWQNSSEFSLRVSVAADTDWHPGLERTPVSISWVGVETPITPFAYGEGYAEMYALRGELPGGLQ